MIRYLTHVDQHDPALEVRAGGTDLVDRQRRRLVPAACEDLRDVPGLDGIVDGRIGAKLTVAALASDPAIRSGWPALAAAAGALATPQIRAVGTLGGNLNQRWRCSWYRDPGARCLLRTGGGCPARASDRQYFAIDDAPCIAVHPSTLACALLLYEAGVEQAGELRPFEAWLASPGTALLTHVVLPAPAVGERGGYHRASHRSRAEWPLVEVAARRVGDRVWVAAGGVAMMPVRLGAVEAAWAEGRPEPWMYADAGFRAHPDTAFKTTLLRRTTQVVLESLA